MAKIVRSVHVTDPDRPGLSVLLEAGQTVPDHLAGQITNPDVWEDGKLPAAAKHAAKDAEDTGADSSDSDADGDGEKSDTKQAASAAKKTAAKKTATTPARGRTAAGEGASGN